MSTIEEQNVKESTRAVMARALPGLATIIDARRREGKVDLRTTIAVIVLDLDPEQHEGLVVRLMRADEALAYVRALVHHRHDRLLTTIFVSPFSEDEILAKYGDGMLRRALEASGVVIRLG